MWTMLGLHYSRVVPFSMRRFPLLHRISPPFCRATRSSIASPAPKPTTSLALTIPTGLFSGTLGALSGVGGGIVILPILSHFTNFSQRVINGTSILSVTIGASFGAWNYFHLGVCNLPIAALISASSILMTKKGVKLAQRMSNVNLTRAIATAMLGVVPLILNKPAKPTLSLDSVTSVPFSSTMTSDYPCDGNELTSVMKQFQRYRMETNSIEISPKWKEFFQKVAPRREIQDGLEWSLQFLTQCGPYLFVGMIAGWLSGLLGIGGGIIMTSCLSLLTSMPQVEIIGTSLLAMIPIGISSSFHNLQAKTPNLPSSIAIGISLTASMWFTSKYVTTDIPEERLRQILVGILSISSILMFKKTL